MKKTIIYAFLIASSSLFIACGGSEEKKSSLIQEETTTNSSKEENSVVEKIEEKKVIAIALWNASIKNAAGKEGKWVASYKYGENLILLGEEEKNGKRTEVKVRTSEGKEGWTSDYLIAQESKFAVITENTVIYSKPTPIGVSKEKLKVGDFVAIYNEEMNGYHEFHGKEKKVKGWIKRGYSFNETDIEVAILRQHILDEKDEERKALLIEEVKMNENYQSSSFYTIIIDENTPKEVEIIEDDIEVITNDNSEQLNEVLEKVVDDVEKID